MTANKVLTTFYARYSGDSFHNAAALERLEWYMARWQKEVAVIREQLAGEA